MNNSRKVATPSWYVKFKHPILKALQRAMKLVNAFDHNGFFRFQRYSKGYVIEYIVNNRVLKYPTYFQYHYCELREDKLLITGIVDKFPLKILHLNWTYEIKSPEMQEIVKFLVNIKPQIK